MTKSGGEVIRRKIMAAKGRKPDAAVMDFAEALCGKIGEALLLEPKFGLSPAFHGAEITTFETMLGEAPAKSLFCFTDDILIHLDNALAYTWIENSLSGEKSIGIPPENYAPPAIDAVMSRPFFECLYAAIARDLPNGGRPDQEPAFEEMTIERNVDNVRFLEGSTKIVVMAYAFGETGGETGATQLLARYVIPLTTIEEIVHNAAPRRIEDAPSTGLWASHMQDETLSTPLDVRALIDRTPTPLNEIAKFRPGYLLMIPREKLENAQVAVDCGGRVKTLAFGRLGQFQDAKALKLNNAPDERAKELLLRTLL